MGQRHPPQRQRQPVKRVVLLRLERGSRVNEFKGTPGPWKFFEVEDGIGVVGPCADVAHCMGFDSNRSLSEERANAKLIAAAPDLLAALQGVLRVADRATDEFDAARAAILKATSNPN